ncbi:related to severin kinase [Phialocephala subalpina]|uniref:non-specific serine/threonine protein kinase n=1 Tax=Phialocephala subalpina TaxID=576137 RepID=A0A1L7WCW9_9HELO|nr:related to severin kinase [Phialocephala subalpina]
MENRLQIRPPQEISLVKTKAIEDARKVQAQVIEECKRKGKDPPPYVLEELIGKGSFGRVYKGKDMKTADIVAIKIIDLDESDTLNPRLANSYGDFIKEINALTTLGESKAKNINHVIAALPVGKAMWMITEYCAGGSVATLMKPTSPGGLSEKWIIPILREVALALRCVHEAGIIHRDIKCANVLVHEQGNIQVCDFGIAGIVESKLDKRSTIIGTPHWMAPEMFKETTISYGKEVDIWAFGCMAFELATGGPPFAREYAPDQLAAVLQSQVPRLEDTNKVRFSDGLKSLVAFCIQEDPKARPTIEDVQKHSYLLNTESSYPASSLRSLVGSFKVWESSGGSRKSLFFQHPSQSAVPDLPSAAPADEGWIFSTTAMFDLEVSSGFDMKDVMDAYGPAATTGFDEDTARPTPRQLGKGGRRRPPPEALKRLPGPLEKLFDPNTMTNYEENSRIHYGAPIPPPATSELPPEPELPPPPTHERQSSSMSDLPLRGSTTGTMNRESLIDMDLGFAPPTTFNNMDTIRASTRPVHDPIDDDYTPHDFSRPALSDPADVNPNRHTQDWKFPAMAPPASADPELSRFPITYDLPRPAVTPGSGGRPPLVHHPTEPLGNNAFGGGLQPSLTSDRTSMQSLIDLDMSLPDTIPEYRPSTANSDVGSTTSEHLVSANPFELEKHTSFPPPVSGVREPSIYVSDDSTAYEIRNGNSLREAAEMSDFSASDAEGNAMADSRYDDDGYYVVSNPATNGNGTQGSTAHIDDRQAFDSFSMPPPRLPSSQSLPRDDSISTISSGPLGTLPRLESLSSLSSGRSGPLPSLESIPTTSMPKNNSSTSFSTYYRIPPLPDAPSVDALSGVASQEDMSEEITRMMTSMSQNLMSFKEIYEDSSLVQKRGSLRREARDPAASG